MTTKEKIPSRAKQHTVYKLKDGTRVPGVTTILNVLAKPALIPWANRIGLQGIKVAEYVDEKAAIGTLAHAMIAAYLKGEDADTSEYTKAQIDQAENSCLSFFEWEKGHEIESVLIEQPLVSEQLGYGGTIDWFVLLDSEYRLRDFKTGKAIWPEMPIQLAAYEHLLFENNYRAKDSGFLRIGRDEDEGFEQKIYTNLDRQWQIFLACLDIYQLQKDIKGDK